jgi:hypothetical protein
MKVLITEDRLEKVITDYLDDFYYPDYGWGPELHDFYREDIDLYGGYEFEVNDEVAYSYYDSGGYTKTLIISKWLTAKLTSLFAHMWEPVFIKWFEDNSGLKVESIEK